MEVSCILINDEGKITAARIANAEQRNSKFLRQREDPRGPLERATNGGQVEVPYLIVFHVITDTWADVLYTHVFAYAHIREHLSVYAASGPRKCSIHRSPFPLSLPCRATHFDSPLTFSRSKPQDSVLIYIGLTPGAPFASAIFSKCFPRGA